MDLEIKYDNGSMVIHLEAFLGCQSITKVRKLVKVIQGSYTSDVLDKMKEFVEQQLEQFEQNEQTPLDLQRYREENKELKAELRQYILKYKECIRDKAFYEKVLETIS